MGLKKYIGLIVAILLAGFTSLAQNKHIIIYGKITDKASKGIAYAAVENMNTSDGINADARGFYRLKTTLPAKLNAFSLAYKITEKEVNDAPGDSIEVNFALEDDSAQLQTVTVTTSHPAQLVEQSPILMDFEVKDNRLWLVYAVKGGDKIVVTDTGGKELTHLTLNYHFHKDSIDQTPHGFLYSIYGDSLLLYSFDSNKIKIKTMDMVTYQQYSGTLVGFRFPYYYYISFDSLGSRVNYSCYDKTTNKETNIYKYIDSKLHRANRETEETMLLLQLLLPLEDEHNGQAGVANRMDTLANFLGYIPQNEGEVQELLRSIYIPQGASSAELENAYNNAQSLINSAADPFAAENEGLALSTMKGKVFSILRIVNDSVYIFNFDNNTLNVYSLTNVHVRQVSLGVSSNALKFRKKNILVDEVRQDCYFKYSRGKNTYLQKLNLATGKVSYTIILKYPYVDKVRISDGYAYFSYFNSQERDNIYNGKNCIYKQKLD